jgi:hypothetical protein
MYDDVCKMTNTIIILGSDDVCKMTNTIIILGRTEQDRDEHSPVRLQKAESDCAAENSSICRRGKIFVSRSL